MVKGLICMIAAASLWGFLGTIVKACFALGIQPMEIAFWRLFLSGIAFFIHALLIKKYKARPSHCVFFMIFGFLSCGLYNFSYNSAVQYVGASMGGILLYTAPVWVALFAWKLFGERLSTRSIVAMGIAFAGIFLVCLSGGSLVGQDPQPIGLFYGALAGFLYAMLFPFTLIWTRQYHSVTIYAWIFLSGAFVLLPFVTFADKGWQAWVLLLLLGFGTTYVGYYLYAKGITLLGTVKAVIIANLEPVIGIFVAWIFWDESFKLIGWIGSAFVLAAVFILALQGASRSRLIEESQ